MCFKWVCSGTKGISHESVAPILLATLNLPTYTTIYA